MMLLSSILEGLGKAWKYVAAMVLIFGILMLIATKIWPPPPYVPPVKPCVSTDTKNNSTKPSATP